MRRRRSTGPRPRARRALVLVAALAAGLLLAPLAGTAAAQGTPRYVALGDSYSSGNAAGWYWDTTCFNSWINYASWLHWELAVQGKPGYPLTQAPSCSGAQTGRLTPPYGRAEGGYFTPHDKGGGYVRAAQQSYLTAAYAGNDGGVGQAFDGAEVGLVTLTLGGNDIGFADTVTACLVGPVPCTDREGPTLAAIAALGPVLDEVYADIAARAPRAQIRVVNYPAPISEATEPYCRSISVNAGIGIDDAEVAFARRAQDALNAQIAAAVARVQQVTGSRLQLVDAAAHFRGHEACAGSEDWMRGVWLVPGFVEESFHVNDRGHAQIAKLVANSL